MNILHFTSSHRKKCRKFHKHPPIGRKMVGVVARKPWRGENGNLTSGSNPQVTERPLSQRNGSKPPAGREGGCPRPQTPDECSGDSRRLDKGC